MILDLSKVRAQYAGTKCPESEFIVELVDRLKEELEAGSQSKAGVQRYIKLWEREKGVVDRLIAAIGRNDVVTESNNGGIRMR